MCFGPSAAEVAAAKKSQQQQAEAAATQRAAADAAARNEADRLAGQKASDISEAISATDIRQGMQGGSGRRSLFSSSGAGFLGRFS